MFEIVRNEKQVIKGYSSGQSHFSGINVKLATHFVKKMFKDAQKLAYGNRLVLPMTTAGIGASQSKFVEDVVARFPLFYKQRVIFGVVVLVR